MVEAKSSCGHDEDRHNRRHQHHRRHRKVKEIESNIDPCQQFKITMNEDGNVERYAEMPSLPATGDEEKLKSESLPLPEVLSKDIVLDAEKKTWLRIYRPTMVTPGAGLPIIFSFHAGAFIIFDFDTCFVHEGNENLSLSIPAVIVSVGYRNAPENRLPAAYEDAVDAINWVKDQALNQETGEPWLRDYGDFSKCYLQGRCSGGNIALNAAIRVADMNLDPISIAGLILNQPCLGGKKRTRSEIKYASDPVLPLVCTDLAWDLALPVGADRDHKYSNPMKDPETMEKMNHLGKILVIGFGSDPMVDRQQKFVKMLTMQGIPVQARFDQVGFHCVDAIDQERAAAIITLMKEFMGV